MSAVSWDPGKGPSPIPGDGHGLLEDFSEDDWGLFFTFLDKRRFATADVLLREGDAGREMFILTEGSVEVRVEAGGQPRAVDVIEEGTIFGEQSFADGGSRTAMIVAISDGECYRLGQKAFDRLCAEYPEMAVALMRDIARVLSLRCRQLQRVRSRLLAASG